VAAKRFKRHRVRRWIIQFIFLGLFIFLFVQTKYGQDVLFQHLFFRFDPLVLIVVSIAYRSLITASVFSLILITGTLIFGRFFCGYVCPLGTCLDIFDSAVRIDHKRTFSLKNGKYLILCFLLIAAVVGASFVHFFDPLIIFERSLTLLFFPVVTYFVGLVTTTVVAVYTETVIALIVFIGILSLGFIVARFWCRNICPLGGMYAILSKFSLFKTTFGDGCNECGICETVCPMGAIDMKNQKIDSGECITCLRCLYECPHDVIEYRFHREVVPFDIKRRQLIGAVGAGIVVVPFVRFMLHERLEGRFIRPPGSVPEADFLNACLRCGKCMKVCPTNGIQPTLLEAGMNELWTPRLVPRIGGCEKNCNLCGQVCPTGAIRRLSLEEKSYARMGTAVMDRARCIAWEQDKVCLVCDEVCPFNAVISLNETVRGVTILRPFVDERICTGCGLCEAVCPIEGEAAIQVYSIGEERIRSGSYITAEKRRFRSCEQRNEDIPSGFILDRE
jgi:MauM/NapG family ferredoxin protein